MADWLSYLIRWAHLIAGISWIGNSFYFMWLDSHLELPSPERAGVEGFLWMVHSGGFYQVEKRKIRPGEVPPTLHWFYWEATLTLITGLMLLSVLYYWRAESFLIDPAVWNATPAQAIGASVGLLAGFWFVYDGFWQWGWSQRNERAATFLSLGALAGLSYLLCHLFSGRGAFLSLGAILGTSMVVNVWVRILPVQQKMIDATRRGVLPDYGLGKKAKRRSIHNSYLTLPVLFAMLSNHYAMAYAHPRNWAVLIALIAVGMAARHVMIVRNRGQSCKRPVAIAAATLFFLVGVSLPPREELPAVGAPPTYAQIGTIVANRCSQCHSGHPTDDVWKVAPKGLIFDTEDALRKNADQIKVMVVVAKAMPLANKTHMTDDERTTLGRWLEGLK